MSLDIQQSFDVHAKALKYRVQRAEVIAGNLANVNTPGYLAKDLDFQSVLQQLDKPEAFRDDLSNAYRYRIPQQNASDGNTVELGVEQAAFAENKMDFQMSLTFLNMKLSGIKKVLKDA